MSRKYIYFLLVTALTTSTFVFYNNFSAYRENPASDLLLEYDRLQEEASNKRLSVNGARYLNRVLLEISNRIAFRLKIRDCTEFFNEHPSANNGKYILYPESIQNKGAVFSCEKKMTAIKESRIVQLGAVKPRPQRDVQSIKSFQPAATRQLARPNRHGGAFRK